MKVLVERETNPLVWSALVAADPDASVFHEPGFQEALRETYRGFRPHHLLAYDDAGHLLGGLPGVRVERAGMSQILSLPFGSYATPLVAAHATILPDPVRRALVDRWCAEALRSGVVRAQFVPFARHAADPTAALAPPEWRQPERTHVIPLAEGFDQIWFSRYDKENRTAARKAVRAGVVVTEEAGEAGADLLETLYRRQARDWSGHAPYRRGLFHRLVERLGERARVWVARHQESPVFALLAFYHKGVVTPWVSGASAGARALCAGNLIHKVVIEDACRRGFADYNFGGSGGVAGIEAFKVAFGGEAIDYSSWFRESAWFGRARLARRRVLRLLGRE